jgi:hypothetical protein
MEGPTSDVYLVHQMQPKGDLQNAWMMFKHVKHVKGWTTIACHVYESEYCKVLTIIVWHVVKRHKSSMYPLDKIEWHYGKERHCNPNFKGFMVDSAKANWNIVYIVYGSGDSTMHMMTRNELVNFIYWTQSMDKDIKQSIKP